MKTRTLKQLVLYNYRYFFAYAVIVGFVAYFLLWQLGSIGPGLSGGELITSARHTTLSNLLQIPLHPLHSILQWASIQVFGVSTWAIRLPSVVLAGATAFFLYNLLKKWFGKSTALLSTAIFISADWFLFVARLGTGSIEFSFWLSISLFCFTKLIERRGAWLPILALSLAGLLFSPLGIYAVVTLIAALLGFKVFRERLHAIRSSLKVIAYLIVILALSVFVYASIKNIEFLKNVLGVQNVPTVGSYLANVFSNLSSPVAILPAANPTISPTGILLIRLFEFITILFGVAMFWKTRVNRLNLTVLILSVVLALASGFSDGSRGSGVMLVPAAIYMTAGIRHLMHLWKRTFPKNPYARVAAYVPLGILFVLVVIGHYLSYFVVWPTQASTHGAFSKDFALVKAELNRAEYENKNCLIQTEDANLQQLIAASGTICTPLFPSDSDATNAADVLILQPSATGVVYTSPEQKTRALVSQTKENNVRWVVVTSDQ